MEQVYDPSKFSISVTATAEYHFCEIVKDAKAYGVRLQLKPSGCAGFAYHWGLLDSESDIQPDDHVVQLERCVLAVASMALPYLKDGIIDLRTRGIQKEIVVDAPSVTNSCGCGESVSFDI